MPSISLNFFSIPFLRLSTQNICPIFIEKDQVKIYIRCKCRILNLECLDNTLGNNTIECKKLATIVSGRKTQHVARSTQHVITQSVIQSFLNTPVCSASLSHSRQISYFCARLNLLTIADMHTHCHISFILMLGNCK